MPELVRTYIERNISGSWSDMSAYVVGDLEIEYLIPSNSDDEKLASVGRLRMTINNGNGLFSPSAVFRRGTKVRVRTVYQGTSKTRFVGNILVLDPDTLEWGDQFVRVTAVDWMNIAIKFPMDTAEQQANKTVEQAVTYLLTLMDIQPESVDYRGGRETFDFVFDSIKKQTMAYSELNKLALSEFAPFYLKGDGTLVIESADTRHGMRELTKVPQAPSKLEAILTDPQGKCILVAEGTQFAILADRAITPNLATGTYQPSDIVLENEPTLTNVVTAIGYPTRTDASNVKLFQLDAPIMLFSNKRLQIRGNWANPNGGEPINAKGVVTPLITGTNFTMTSLDGSTDVSTSLSIACFPTSKGHVTNLFNFGQTATLTRLEIYGKGIYPYNPVEIAQGVTGSFTEYGKIEIQIDQKYQDDVLVSERIAETVVEDNKVPANRLVSETFDASLSPELMQASQYMDIGDLTWIKNVKPSVNTYAYLRGKKIVISPSGWVTETWYLKEMDSARNGLQPVALYYRALQASQNAVDFGSFPKHGSGGLHTWTIWLYPINNPSSSSLMSKTDEADTGTRANDIFMMGAASPPYIHHALVVRRAFTDGSAGIWQSASGTMSSKVNGWHHVAMVYDDSSPLNNPTLYLDGVSLPLEVTSRPTGGRGVDYSNAPLILGNINLPGSPYTYNLNGLLKDARIYDRGLTQQEIIELASSQTNFLAVPNGLVFQAPFVKREDYIPTGTYLFQQDKLIDNMYGLRGTPNFNNVSGTAYQIMAIDPNTGN